MKQLSLIPLVLGLATLLGYGLLRATGTHVYVREMIAALIPSLVAGMGAVLPALIQRPHGQAAVVQGAFQGMLIHMGVTIGLGVILFLGLGMKGPSTQPFALWMMWFFAVTLSLVATSLIRVIRKTPMAPSEATPPAIVTGDVA